MSQCEICGNADQYVHDAREMMFGTRERFRYMECRACGCLQLLDVPDDLSRFYPESYYSFAPAAIACDPPLVARIKKVRANVLLRSPLWLVRAIRDRIPRLFVPLAGLGLRTRSAVCDVGCGGGDLLVSMHREGFERLAGFDPYLPEDRLLGGVISLRRARVEDMPGGWDLIMLHHSFEHMAEPARVLELLRTRLNPGGRILIRVPLADSWAWRTYGPDWVSLDAPRHLFVHTERSMGTLAERSGLVISRAFRDSHALQFWGSEQYRRDLPLRDPESHAESGSLFTTAEIAEYEHRSAELNRRGEGDSGAFVLTEPGVSL